MIILTLIYNGSSTFLHVLGLCIQPNFRYSWKCLAEIYRAQYENAIFARVPPWDTNMVAGK